MKILICLLFKDSILWLNRFMSCLEDLIDNKPEYIVYDINVIYGDSKDSTDIEVKKRMNELNKYDEIIIKMTHIPLPRRLDRIEKLAILRNASIIMSDIEYYDYILQIDTDIIFDSDSIYQLIGDIERDDEKKIGIISPLIYIEETKIFYDTWAYRMDGGKMFRPDISPEFFTKKYGGLFEVDSVGTMYICRSDIFWKYDIKYGTELIKTDESKVHPQRRYESEQVVWCNQVRERTGYKIMVDPNIMIEHINLEKYGKSWH